MRIDNALAQVSRHKHLIIVVIGVAAIASYMIPFANLFAIADASGDYWKKSKVDFKKKKFEFKFAKFFQKLFIKNLIFNSERTTNTFKNFGVDQLFNNINAGATTGSGSGSLAINQGSNFFLIVVQNCPSAAGSGSGSTSTSSTSCTQTVTQNVQANPYLFFGGSV
jgi:hypothetical protein